MKRLKCWFVIWLTVGGGLVWGQSKPTLDPKDYGRWESLSGRPRLSADGSRLAYQLRRVNGEWELRLRDLAPNGQERIFEWGQNPVFSADGRWLAWAVGVSDDEREKLEKADKPVRLSAALLEAGQEEQKRYSDVSRFAFDETGHYLALIGYPPKEPKGQGADLRIVDLGAGSEVTFGNVSDFAWSDSGSLLALTVATGSDEGNGIQVYDAASGRLRGLDASASSYRQPAWRDNASDLAVLRSTDPASKEGTAHQVLIWKGLSSDSPEHRLLAPDQVPAGLEVVRHRRPRWAEDGTALSLGLRKAESKSNGDQDAASPDDGDETGKDETGKDEPELPAVQIWHSSDVRLFPEQKTAHQRDSRRTLLALWRLDADRVVTIGTDVMEQASLVEGWRHGVEDVAAPYSWGRMFGRPYHDVWVIDTQTGRRSRALEKVRYSWESAGGRFLLSFDGRHYWTTELETGRRVNITADLKADFANAEYDTPTDLTPPYGVGGWLAGDEAVLLYDRFDVWRVSPDGSGAARLTRGASDEIVHRLVDLDAEEEAFDMQTGLYFSLRGERTEKRGYALLTAGDETAVSLIYEDKRIGGLQRADEAEVLLYRSEARDDSPDYFVAGPQLAEARQVTRTNPFQDDYAWTRAELIDFQSETGQGLQAALLYPANHDPGRRYPMIVYTYEVLAPQIHSYEPPSERDYYNFTAWTQAGYFVLMPDIVYTARDPGVSALAAVGPAVKSVVERGLVDEAAVGLIGHSWGGYQATYLPTRTDIFAASVAGAPLTDFVSFMGQLHWNQGAAELSHWETGQARMEVPFWEDPEAHRRNSPIHKVHDMETPLLMAFGDNDGVVDWDQGTEFFNFARRAGKQMVLLVYEGENHGFSNEANQVDYHRRILEWFGHYLKGDPAPDWIRQGVAYDDLEDEKKRIAGSGGS